MADQLGRPPGPTRSSSGRPATAEADRLREENRRLTVAIELARGEAESLQAKLARELERALGATGQIRDDCGRLVGELEPSPRENGRLSGEHDRIPGEPSLGGEDIGVIVSDVR